MSPGVVFLSNVLTLCAQLLFVFVSGAGEPFTIVEPLDSAKRMIGWAWQPTGLYLQVFTLSSNLSGQISRIANTATSAIHSAG